MTMLHGITVVDRKNMTKNEEEMMRQLHAACIAAGYPAPQLRAKSHIPGKEGWTMEVGAGDRIIGEGRNARRGAAGEAALSNALLTVTGRAAAATGVSTLRRQGDAAGVKESAAVMARPTVVTKNNMSTHEKELMDQLFLLAKGKGFTEAPQLRACKAPRGEENWTMEVVAGSVLLSSAKGKRRSFAGKIALQRAIDALRSAAAADSGAPAIFDEVPRAASTAALAGSPATGSSSPKLPPNFAAAVGKPLGGGSSARSVSSKPAFFPLQGLLPEDEELLKQLREACEAARVFKHPLIRSRKQTVWSKVSWTVEVLIGGSTDANGPPPWLKEESTLDTQAAALRAALTKAVATAKEKGTEAASGSAVESLPLAATGIDKENIVFPGNLTPASLAYLRRLRVVLDVAEIFHTPQLRNNPKKKQGDVFHMEVVCGERVLGCSEHKQWQMAGEAALKNAIESVTAICKARNGGAFEDAAGRGTLHGITVVDPKNMTKGEEDLMRKLRARCGVDTPSYVLCWVHMKQLALQCSIAREGGCIVALFFFLVGLVVFVSFFPPTFFCHYVSPSMPL